MSPPESIQEEWLRIARRDWRRHRLLLGAADAVAAGFYLQQALEKFLKAYLVARGWELRRTHEVDRLLDAAASYDTALAAFRPLCERASSYYMVERYPGIGAQEPGVDEVAADAIEAAGLVRALFPGEHMN